MGIKKKLEVSSTRSEMLQTVSSSSTSIHGMHNKLGWPILSDSMLMGNSWNKEAEIMWIIADSLEKVQLLGFYYKYVTD